MKIGTHPAAGADIRLSEPDKLWVADEAMPIEQAQQLVTDARGHFAFERVMPARLFVRRLFTLERSTYAVGIGYARAVTVKPERRPGWISAAPAARWSAASCCPPGSKPAPSSPATIKPWSGSVRSRLIR